VKPVISKTTVLLAAVALAATSYQLFVSQPSPWLYLFPLWLLASVVAAVGSRRTLPTALWINLAAVLLVLSLAEVWFWHQQTSSHVPALSSDGYHQADDLLGYRPAPSQSRHITRYNDDELSYDVHYSTDKFGLRTHSDAKTGGPCILFFGGSFMFGEGLEDDQTLPWLVAQQTGYSTHNFGASGYGSHQMLAALEQGLVQQVAADCDVIAVVYQGLMDHIARAAGKRSWDQHGPRYELDDSGKISYRGHFDDPRPPPSLAQRLLNRSYIYRNLIADSAAISEQDIDRFIAIIDASSKAVAKLYPNASFDVIMWGSKYQRALDGIRELGIPLHLAEAIQPDYDQHPEKYRISRHDKHPNERLNKRLADYVVSDIVGK
jgi:hypothetical protein